MNGFKLVEDTVDIAKLLISHFQQRFNKHWLVNGFLDELQLPTLSVDQVSSLE